MTDTPAVTVQRLSAGQAAERLPDLAALLQACVEAGASINFVWPFTQADAAAFWRQQVLPAAQAGERVLWVAEEADGRIVGSVQLGYAPQPNQPHRAEVTKLMVHPRARRRGLGRALMAKLERHAGAQGRKLITLDTRTGDAAEYLYGSLGYRTVGTIPGYCRDPFVAERFDSTTVMYKTL